VIGVIGVIDAIIATKWGYMWRKWNEFNGSDTLVEVGKLE